jgi:hypothetical protein
MRTPFQRYIDELTSCMMTYQFIEEGLRFCLYRCHATIQFRLDGYLPYEAPSNTIGDAALGRLVDWYKVFTSNESLIREIRAIKSDRDRLAHQGLVFTLEEQSNDSFLRERTEDLKAAHAKADACFTKLRAEMEATDEVVNRAYGELRTERLGLSESAKPAPTDPTDAQNPNGP